MLRIVFVLVVVLNIALCLDDIETQVKEIYESFTEATNAQDIQEMTSNLTEDCILFPPNLPPILGKPAIEEHYQNMLTKEKWPKIKILTYKGIIENSAGIVVSGHAGFVKTYHDTTWRGSGVWIFRIVNGLVKLRAAIWNSDDSLILCQNYNFNIFRKIKL